MPIKEILFHTTKITHKNWDHTQETLKLKFCKSGHALIHAADNMMGFNLLRRHGCMDQNERGH
jgi:hypothetical protein